MASVVFLKGVNVGGHKTFRPSVLASRLHADLLLISTSVEKVSLHFKQANQRDLDNLTLSEAKRYYQEGHFAKGSMGPKIQAVINYLENGGHSALITMPESIGKALSGQTGTWIRQDS